MKHYQDYFILSLGIIFSGRNLAFKRTSSQSSTPKRCEPRYCKSSNAVDGYTSTKYMYECSLTNEEENPWWQVYTDYKIRMWNIEIKGKIKKINSEILKMIKGLKYVIFLTLSCINSLTCMKFKKK
jgi:hypothetical protein